MKVVYHPEAEAELLLLPEGERDAMENALEKLERMGRRLLFPHQSAVKGAGGLRELRPRRGRSRWRALYRQVGESMFVAAIGPEASVDPAGFRRSVTVAIGRLKMLGPTAGGELR